MTLFLLTDILSAQNRTRINSKTFNNQSSGNCCENAQGVCVDERTQKACSVQTNCAPCATQNGPQAPTVWGPPILGEGNPCNKPNSADCNGAIFKTRPVKNHIPIVVDKLGIVHLSKASIGSNFLPAQANAFNLGSSKLPFKTVFARKIVGQVSKYSDRRLKTNIEALPYGLQTVMNLKPSAYHYKNNLSGNKELGLIAQDLQETVPEVVSESGDYLSVDYTALVPVLIQAIQDQQALIEAQKSTIEGQKTAMEKTEIELKDLKANLSEVMDFLQLKEKKVSEANE